MLKLALAQMRSSIGRLIAAGIAISLGTGFVAATLLGLDAVTEASRMAVTTTLANADVVVTPNRPDDQLTAVLATPGVRAAHANVAISMTMGSGSRYEYLDVTKNSAEPQLRTATIIEGSEPDGLGEIALSEGVAERLDVEIGATTTVEIGMDVDGEWVSAQREVRVVGLVSDLSGIYYAVALAVVSPEQFDAWSPPEVNEWAQILVLADSGVGTGQLASDLAERLGQNAEVMTMASYADEQIQEFTGGVNVLAGFVLAFAAIALFVAAIVITNTFQVVVAQRTRTLALLRCVGATRSQVRRSILLEAAILGLLASIAGTALGAAALQVMLVVLGGQNLDVPLPTSITPTVLSIALPLVLGVLVTVGAALAPARAATRVSPVAALRPLEVSGGRKASVTRAVAAGLLGVGGLGIVVLATVVSLAAKDQDPTTFVLLGVFGGVLSFVGLLVGALFLVPPTSRLLGLAAGRLGGVPGQLATANSVRNPRRTTATATAIIIGSTLVALMATGAASARVTMTSSLDSFMPVDVSVSSGIGVVGDGSTADGGILDLHPKNGLIRPQHDALAAIDGVAGLIDLRSTLLDTSELQINQQIHAVPDNLGTVYRGTDTISDLGDDEIAVTWGLEDGQQVVLTGVRSGSEPVTVTARLVESSPRDFSYVTQATLDRIDPNAPVTDMWMRIADAADPLSTVKEIQTTITDLSGEIAALDPDAEAAPYVSGGAVERAGFQQVIDTMLAIVLGLLAVAVIIALIGVANTLSLSVLERRRESATLRALGLTKKQLRVSLAIEGIMLATVGALIGVVMGVVYGIAGSTILLSQVDGFIVAVPWREVAVVFVVAVVAGLLASVLPSRSAVRTSPVAALAVD